MPLERLQLPTILRVVAELADAVTAYQPEDHPEITTAQADPNAIVPSVEAQFRWHDDLDVIRDTANRLKRALGATGELRPGRVLADETPVAWRHFDSRFQDLDYSRSVRIGLRRLALAATDLSGYAELRQPPDAWRSRSLRLLHGGVIQVWPALSASERDEVRELLPVFRMAFAWAGETSNAPPTWAGPVEIAAEDEYQTIDITGGYYNRGGAYLDFLGALAPDRSPREQASIPTPNSPLVETCAVEKTCSPTAEQPLRRPKRSTVRGDARIKIIAALTKHHQYAEGGALNQEPVGNNELAELADVDKATASAFFKKEFGGHGSYVVMCQDVSRLAASLKHLNGEYTPQTLFGGEISEHTPDEGE